MDQILSSTSVNRLRDKFLRLQEEYRRRRIPQPSFYVKLAERKRRADRVRRLRDVSIVPIYPLETKVGQKKIAEKSGIATASILQGPVDSLSEFDLVTLPERFVIKPIIGSGGNGVFLLKKEQDNLLNLVSGERYPSDLSCLHSAGLERFEGCPWIAEEFIGIGDRPSLNWKAYSFYGKVGFIRQLDLYSEPKRYKVWSPEGRELGIIDRHSYRYDSTLPAPRDIKQIVKAAETISRNITTPFVRVDMYESDHGVHLGEITLRPGSLWKRSFLQIFTAEWDRKLGEMWEEAEARIVEDVGESYIP